MWVKKFSPDEGNVTCDLNNNNNNNNRTMCYTLGKANVFSHQWKPSAKQKVLTDLKDKTKVARWPQNWLATCPKDYFINSRSPKDKNCQWQWEISTEQEVKVQPTPVPVIVTYHYAQWLLYFDNLIIHGIIMYNTWLITGMLEFIHLICLI